MPWGGGGHVGGEDTRAKQANTEPYKGKHDSAGIMSLICLRQEL
jgi:hypothetical protein